MLENIKSPADIKNLSHKELKTLAQEIRKEIIEVVGKNGGHLASNLGVVELTIALHRVFDSPNDAIIWDVSHQCYAHKLLTGRYDSFASLRQKDGISGFTNTEESPHDYFINGHSSTSISSALGLLTSWELNKKEGKVIAVIGDGALTGGLAFEGLCNAGQLCKNLIVILNDNQMSIDHNTGAISRYLSRLTMTKSYQSFRYSIDRTIERFATKIPYLGRGIEKFIFRFKRSLKGLILTNNLFTDLGFEYVGPLNGHDEADLEKVLNRVKKLHRPVVVHVVTKKGKGYDPAEKNPEIFHGVGPFDTLTGIVDTNNPLSFTDAFSQILMKNAASNEKIAAITAAMSKGTGLSDFEALYKDRFFDVGIAEEHAVTFAGGLAKGGMIPVVCIYSTFIQRAIDQIVHDIALQNLHAIFMLDRAGAVPCDGVPHQGVFDISFFRPIPNLVIMSPATKNDLETCFEWALESKKAVAIRYPKTNCPPDSELFSSPIEVGRGLLIKKGVNAADSASDSAETCENKVLIVSTGGMYSEVNLATEKINESKALADIYLMRFIKPLDEEYFVQTAKKYKGVLFVEDGVRIGGISVYLDELLARNNYTATRILAFGDKFYSHGNRSQILEAAGLSVENIIQSAGELLCD